MRNTEARTAFKVPHDWTVFDEATMQGDPQGTHRRHPDPVEWLVGLDGDPSPAREHVLSLADGYYTAFPQGIAAVLRLTSQQFGTAVKLGALRNLIDADRPDPDQVGAEAISMIAYDDRSSRTGSADSTSRRRSRPRHSRACREPAAGLRAPPCSSATTISRSIQTAYMDPGCDKVYILAVLCSAECYGRNRGDIETVINSWAVIA